MTFREVIHFILNELSAGTFLQNIAFYALLILLTGVVVSQFRQFFHKYKVN